MLRATATGLPSSLQYVSSVSMKWPTPRLVVFSGDTDTTSSTTLSRSPSNTGAKNSTSLDALMIAVPGNGTRTAIEAVGGSPLGTQGGGISRPTNSAGGATIPPHTCSANSGSQYAGLASRTIDAKCWMRAALTALPANLGSVRAPTIRAASS